MRLGLAALAATIVYFALGGIAFAVLPLGLEYGSLPAIFRSQDSMKSVIPAGMIGMLLNIGSKLVVEQAGMYFVEWVAAGIVIYRS